MTLHLSTARTLRPLLLLAAGCLLGASAVAEEPPPEPRGEAPRPTSSLQGASGLQASGGLRTARLGERGPGPAIERMTDLEWRELFPAKQARK